MSGDPFTGEFLLPGDPHYAADLAQHLVPYRHCAGQVGGMRVAEIGCGAGYGAFHLSQAARAVDAYDRNPRAVAWARAHFRSPNLAFRTEGIDPDPDPGAYGAACSFQVIEHLERPGPLLARLGSLVAAGGTIYLTTPNRLTSAGENIYHIREYDPGELDGLLRLHYRSVELRGITGGERFRAYQERRRAGMRRYLRWDPLRLRRLAPRGLLAALYPVLSRAVRHRAAAAEAVPADLGADDFRIDAARIEECDDLFAICRP